MQMKDFITNLKKALPSTSLPIVVSALRHDPLVWENLTQPEFFQRASASAGNESQLWNPAALALIALESDITLSSLRSLPLQPLQPELRQKAARTYEDAFRSGKAPLGLDQAGLLALALRERRRLTDTWQGLGEELQQNQSGKGQIQLDVWRTPIACLFAIAPDPDDLLRALLQPSPGKAAPQARALVLHALLSNPLTLEERVSCLSALLETENPEDQLTWLGQISSMGETALAESLSRQFLEKSESQSESDCSSLFFSKTNFVDPLLQVEPLDQVIARQQLARLHQFAGQPAKALPLLQANQASLHRLQANIAYQASTSISQQKDTKTALGTSQKAYELAPDSPMALAGYASELLRNGQPEKAAELLAGAPASPAVLLANTHLATHAGDLEEARRNALQLASRTPHTDLTLSEYIDLAQSLLDLNLYDDAARIAEQGLGIYPISVDLLNVRSQSLRSRGCVLEAASSAHIAAILAPDQIEQHRLLASMLEETGDVRSALEERNQIVQMNRVPATQDLLELASTAVQAEQPDQAIAACQAALDRDPDCAIAQTRYGEALAQQGQIPAAVQRVEQATLLAPDQSMPWIALANIHKKIGDHRKAIETLRSAAHAAPQSPEIQLALAQLSLEQSSPSEALPALRRAATLAPQSPQITTRLVQTLYQLGHLEEARQLLQKARYLWPTLPDLAFWQAKTLATLGDYQQVLSPLEIALRENPTDNEPYLLLARTMLKLDTLHDPQVDFEKSRQALRKVLAGDPGHFEARILMAETQSASGFLQDALDTYQDLSEMDLAKDPNWNWRIHLGMGRTAMALNQMETAIAALQEAQQIRPDDLQIEHYLAEAYLSARLTDEALVAARTALSMAPDDQANLAWYAHLAVSMHDEGEAINALEHAGTLAPERADVKNQLAQIQLKINDQHAARKSLESVLGLDMANPTDLRETARLFLELKSPEEAAECIRKAIVNAPESSADLWAELGHLQGKVGETENAQESIQKALELRPYDPALHTLYGNTLASENKIQAALSCYEQALALLDGGQKPAPAQTTIPWSYFPEDCSPAKLHLRIAQLMNSLGDLRAALEHAEQAILLDPKDSQARILASQAANSLLEFQRSQDFSIPSLKTSDSIQESSSISMDLRSELALYSLHAEIALENDDLASAQLAVDKAKAISTEDPRVNAALARISVRLGEFQEGAAYLEKALSLKPDQPDQELTSGYPTLPLAEAALELDQWDTALPLFEQVARSLPFDPLAQLSFARALVKAAEAQRILPGLEIKQHLPGPDKLDEASYQLFERAILSANRLSNSTLVARWHRRGQVAFHPSDKTIKALQAVAQTPDDLAVILSAATDIEDVVPADLANQFSNHPTVAFHTCLHTFQANPEEALPIAQALVSEQPSNTLYQALLAKIALTTGAIPCACQSIEAALSSWSDESAWHALAARVWSDCGDLPRSLEHWKAAFDLEPENPVIARSLGEAYSRSGQVDLAVNTLNQAAKLDPDQVETYISLAKARQSAGDYTQAVASAEKAILLAPDSIEPFLLSGEIALAAGQPELARQRAMSALDMEPHHPQAVLLVSRIQAHTGHPAEALQTIEDALPMVAEPFELLLERTRLVRKLQGTSPALHELNDLADQYPEEAQAQAEMALALAELGQSEAAEKAAQAALLLQPDLPDLHLLLGRIQRSCGQLDQALHHLSEAIRQNPHNIEAFLELGRAYQERREYDQAQKIFTQASSLAPYDARPVFQAGLIAKEIKDYITAETMLRKAASLAPDDVNIRRQLAAIIAINLVHNTQEASIPS